MPQGSCQEVDKDLISRSLGDRPNFHEESVDQEKTNTEIQLEIEQAIWSASFEVD